MATDVRVNRVTSRVNAVDAEALLNPEILERIIRAVHARLASQRSADREEELDRQVQDRAVRLD